MSNRKATLLMPVVATLSSALASYLAKKAPQYLEQTVMPKLRETGRSAEQQQQPEQEQPDQSTDELERRRRERAEHRATRRKAS
jgi:hypothetical protein